MANHISHASLPYPIKNARFTLLVPYLDADGDPTDPTTPDTEISQDGGSFADAAEEMTTITGSNGMGYITLSGAEMNNSAVGVAAKVASGPKNTLMTLYPRNLAILESGTASAGAAGTITLASGTYTGLNLVGCFIRTTGGTGGGGTGGANNQARRITGYNTGTRVATVTPNWETTPDNTTTYDVLLPEGILVPMLTALAPTTLGRTLDVSSGGEAGLDWANVGSPTTTLNLSGTTVKTATDVETDTQDIQSRLPAALVSGRIDSRVGAMAANVVTASAIAADAIGASELAADAVTEIQSGLATSASQTTILDRLGAFTGSGVNTVLGFLKALLSKTASTPSDVGGTFDPSTDSVEAIRDRGDAAWLTAAGFSTLTQADVRTAVGLASANLDTQLTAIAAAQSAIVTEVDANEAKLDLIDAVVDAIKLKTDNLPASPAAVGDEMNLANDAITAAKIATDAIGADELATSAVNEIAAASGSSVDFDLLLDQEYVSGRTVRSLLAELLRLLSAPRM